MLAGLGGAAVPVVIHLLGRARYRTLDWGAMMFMTAPAGPKWRDGAKLREWALLGVRMAAVGLLAVALARPVAGGGAGSGSAISASVVGAAGGTPEARLALAIIVDCSANMAYEDVGGSRMDRAKTAALEILSTLRRGDRACLIVAGAGQNTSALAPAAPLTSDLQSLAGRVSELKPTPGEADMADALRAAANVLDRQERAARQIFVVCDRQAQSSSLACWRIK